MVLDSPVRQRQFAVIKPSFSYNYVVVCGPVLNFWFGRLRFVAPALIARGA